MTAPTAFALGIPVGMIILSLVIWRWMKYVEWTWKDEDHG